MNINLSLLLLNFFFVMLVFCCKNSCFCKEYQIQRFRSKIRGQYKNVIQEQRGALISNRNQISFAGTQLNRSPLRTEIYFVNGGRGYTVQYIGRYMIVDLLQNYEINTIKMWMYDRDSYLRTYDLKVYIQGSGGDKLLIYENTVATSIIKIKFQNYFVKQILVYNNNGSSLNAYLHLFNCQAYFQQ
ncbi:unnamed protein product [Paramecium sonneborni]|uniref:Uncharacterized protein n=1 Tax=Paramecium sonneborni TaxID=65129 RepID=A0A8S1RLP4_9CILI|nr:unnamed protein product [Paramecium sonneborni]